MSIIAILALNSFAQAPSVDAIRAAAHQAIGTAAPRIALVGDATLHGLAQSIRIDFDRTGRFNATVTGQLPQSDGFDGKSDWTCGPCGIGHETALLQKETSRLAMWVLSGYWTNPNAPIRLRFVDEADGSINLDMQMIGGVVPATLRLDTKTHLAKSLSYWGTKGNDKWTFTDFKTIKGGVFATTCVLSGGDVNMKVNLSAEKSFEPESQMFTMPVAPKAIYDASKPASVELKNVFGHLFVRPLLDGKDEGWFFLDTGADVLVIDPKVARAHGKPSIGQDTTAGVVAHVDIGYCRDIKFELGPLTLPSPTYAELDLTDFSKAFGFTISGICGYDFLASAVFDINPATKTLKILPSAPAVKWTPFIFDSNTPCVHATFEGNRTGYFNLDTGSDSAVDFCTPTVAKYKLLANRETTPWQTGGAGGSTESRRGKIEWFEIGGHRFVKPVVGFQSTTVGVFASPFFDGNVGMGFLGQFHLILDYAHQRIAFSDK